MKVDVAVIGAGIAGAAIASELSCDHSVMLIEAENRPGYHSTGRSVAILDRTYGNSDVQALTAASLAPLRLLQAEVGGAPFLLARGVLHIASALQRGALAPCDAWPEDVDVALAVARLEAVCDATVTQVRGSWAGLRSFFPDRTPAIGHDPTLPQFFWCAGLGGYGIQTALGAAACLAVLIRAISPPADLLGNGTKLENFAPSRLARIDLPQVTTHGHDTLLPS